MVVGDHGHRGLHVQKHVMGERKQGTDIVTTHRLLDLEEHALVVPKRPLSAMANRVQVGVNYILN